MKFNFSHFSISTSKLKKLNFKGPVGLQCYAVRGDKRTNLKSSMAAWKKTLDAL